MFKENQNTLFGSKFIEQLRSSGYKNPIYAMAEIIDNSVDAKATEIDITIVEQNFDNGLKKTRKIKDVFFIDNGSGMTSKEINGCLRFADGVGRTNERIGAFGVGLPNSSIFVGKRVEVYSKDKKTNQWNFVYLDIDEQLKQVSPGYKPAINKSPSFDQEQIYLNLNLNEVSTIIRWSKIDNIGAARAETVKERSSKLTGRIYRYALLDEDSLLKINYNSILLGNKKYEFRDEVIPYDPLFVTAAKTPITEDIWKASEEDNYNPKLPGDEKFNAKNYYSKYIEGCIKNKTNKPLFQKFDEYWDVNHKISIDGIQYKFKTRASYAYKDIKNPGIRNGGNTIVGKEIGRKMDGERYFKSANIFFIRTNREIDFGNYGFYKNRDPQNRFWTVEVHFGPELDSLMGLDYQKQHVSFEYTTENDKKGIDTSYNNELNINEKRILLYRKITDIVEKCIVKMQSTLKTYGSQFNDKEDQAVNTNSGAGTNGGAPSIEGTTIKAIPKTEQEWDEEDKKEMIKFLKSKYKEIKIDSIEKQVKNYSNGHTKTIVLYRENESNNLFELNTVRGIDVTFINKNHKFYENFISSLKANYKLNEFTTALEILICSFAYQLSIEKRERTETEKTLIQNFVDKTSGILTEFIDNGQVRIDSEAWEKKLSQIK
jgi:hypothetical protein